MRALPRAEAVPEATPAKKRAAAAPSEGVAKDAPPVNQGAGSASGQGRGGAGGQAAAGAEGGVAAEGGSVASLKLQLNMAQRLRQLEGGFYDSFIIPSNDPIVTAVQRIDVDFTSYAKQQGKGHDAGQPEAHRFKAVLEAVAGTMADIRKQSEAQAVSEGESSGMTSAEIDELTQACEIIADADENKILDACANVTLKQLYGKPDYRLALAIRGWQSRKAFLSYAKMRGYTVQAGRAPPSPLERAVQTNLQRSLRKK